MQLDDWSSSSSAKCIKYLFWKFLDSGSWNDFPCFKCWKQDQQCDGGVQFLFGSSLQVPHESLAFPCEIQKRGSLVLCWACAIKLWCRSSPSKVFTHHIYISSVNYLKIYLLSMTKIQITNIYLLKQNAQPKYVCVLKCGTLPVL